MAEQPGYRELLSLASNSEGEDRDIKFNQAVEAYRFVIESRNYYLHDDLQFGINVIRGKGLGRRFSKEERDKIAELVIERCGKNNYHESYDFLVIIINATENYLVFEGVSEKIIELAKLRLEFAIKREISAKPDSVQTAEKIMRVFFKLPRPVRIELAQKIVEYSEQEKIGGLMLKEMIDDKFTIFIKKLDFFGISPLPRRIRKLAKEALERMESSSINGLQEKHQKVATELGKALIVSLHPKKGEYMKGPRTH